MNSEGSTQDPGSLLPRELEAASSQKRTEEGENKWRQGESALDTSGVQNINTDPAHPPRPHHWLWTVAAILVPLAFIVASILYQKGAWLQYEADLFLVDHLGERSFLSKVISPHIHDAEMYQARELSHVLEYVDAHFIYWSVTHKIPHFYSIVNYALLLIISLGFWWNATRHLKLDPMITLLLVSMFWSAPCIFMSGVYIRDAKQGAAFMVFFLLCLIARKIASAHKAASSIAPDKGSRERGQGILWLQTFLLSLGLCWMDRQGFYLVAAIALTLVLSFIGPSVPYRGVLLSALASALLAHSIYGYVIAPPLIQRLTGFKASFGYQKLPLDKSFTNLLLCVWKGFALFIDAFRYFLGNVPMGIAIFIVLGIIWLHGKRSIPTAQPEGNRFGWVPRHYFGVLVGWCVALIVMMNIVMVIRHEAVSWMEVRAFYYWIPATVLVLVGMAFTSHLFVKRALAPLWLTRLFLAAAVLGNLTSLPEHHFVIRMGHLSGYMNAAPFLLTAIKDLYENPPGPGPMGKFDTIASSRNEQQTRLLKDPLDYREMTPEEFVSSSTFYNWLRSKRNLEFRQP